MAGRATEPGGRRRGVLRAHRVARDADGAGVARARRERRRGHPPRGCGRDDRAGRRPERADRPPASVRRPEPPSAHRGRGRALTPSPEAVEPDASEPATTEPDTASTDTRATAGTSETATPGTPAPEKTAQKTTPGKTAPETSTSETAPARTADAEAVTTRTRTTNGTLLTGDPPTGRGATGTGTASSAPRGSDPTGPLLDGHDLRRLGVLGLVVVVIGALVGFGVSFLFPAQYVGRATVLYVITQEDPTGFLREDRNLTTQQLLMQSNAVTAPVAAQYGLTSVDLQEKMTVTLAEGSELITVDVRDPSQELATRIASDVTTQYLQISAATQPMADQAKFLQDQLNTVTNQVNALQTSNTPAALAQLPAAAQRQSQLAQQLDQLNLAQVARPTARLVVPAFPVGQVSPRPWFGAATGAVVGLVVALVTVAVVARRWHRSRA